MCGRFVLDIPAGSLQVAYNLPELPELTPRFNIAPSQPVAVVRLNHADERELVHLRWGLVPAWAKDPTIGAKMINARSETVHEKPSFRQAFRTRRCVIPASGFYEWQRIGTEKIPHYIHLTGDGLVNLAGLWESWKSPEGEVLETCTILTTTANPLIKPLHDRMPVILHPSEIELWLERDSADTGRLTELFLPYPADRMVMHPVSQRVNNPANDSPECLQTQLAG